jgi:hypothetical protein
MWVWWVDPPEDLAPRLSGEGEKAGFFFFFFECYVVWVVE